MIMQSLLFIITSLIWGGAFFLMKKAGLAFGPLTIGASTTFGGVLVLWISWLVKQNTWQIRRQHLIPLLITGLMIAGWKDVLSSRFLAATTLGVN